MVDSSVGVPMKISVKLPQHTQEACGTTLALVVGCIVPLNHNLAFISRLSLPVRRASAGYQRLAISDMQELPGYWL